MARHIDAPAIIAAVRGLIVDGDGVARIVDATRFDSGTYFGMPDNEISRQALVKPRAEVGITSVEPLAQGPSRPCSVALYRFALSVTVSRHYGPIVKLDAGARDAVNAAAWEDGAAIAQALTHPGNVPEGTTGVISSCLAYEGSSTGRIVLDEGRPGLLETVHNFRGFATSQPDT